MGIFPAADVPHFAKRRLVDPRDSLDHPARHHRGESPGQETREELRRLVQPAGNHGRTLAEGAQRGPDDGLDLHHLARHAIGIHSGALRSLGVGRPGAECEHVDAAPAQLSPQSLAEEQIEALRSGVDRGSRHSLERGGGRGEDDAAAPPIDDAPPECVRERDGHLAVELDHAALLGKRELEEPTLHPEACVVHEQPDVARADLRDERVDAARRGEITLGDEGLDAEFRNQLRRKCIEPVAPPRDENEGKPALGELPGELRPDSRRRPGDHRPSPVPLEKFVHARNHTPRSAGPRTLPGVTSPRAKKGSFDDRLGADFIERVPAEPGVYEWLDAGGLTLYVGKAKDLRTRLRAYRTATSRKATRKRWEIVRASTSLRFQTCATELDALLLENELIQRLRPRLNVSGAFEFLYPCIGLRRHEGQLDLVCTTSPQEFPGIGFTGAFRSPSLTRAAFASLVELLAHLGHVEPSKRVKDLPKVRFSRVVRFRRLDEAWDATLLGFLRGGGRAALRPLVFALLERAGARRNAEATEEHLAVLQRFSEEECEPLRAVLLHAGTPGTFLPQRERDRAFLVARATEAGRDWAAAGRRARPDDHRD